MGAFFELLVIFVIFWLVVSFHWTRLLFWVLFLTAFPVAIVGAVLFLASRAIESERVVVAIVEMALALAPLAIWFLMVRASVQRIMMDLRRKRFFRPWNAR